MRGEISGLRKSVGPIKINETALFLSKR
jgi:hypothetical protein